MQHLEVSGAVRPLKWTLGVKWLINNQLNLRLTQPRTCVLETSYMFQFTLLYTSLIMVQKD